MTTIAELRRLLPDTGQCVNDDVLFAAITDLLEDFDERLATVEVNSFSGAVDATDNISVNIGNQTGLLPLVNTTAELASTSATNCRITLTMDGSVSGQGISEGMGQFDPAIRKGSITFFTDENDEFHTITITETFTNPSTEAVTQFAEGIPLPSGATSLSYRVNNLGLNGTVNVRVDLNCSAG